jgi:hypothetical protein
MIEGTSRPLYDGYTHNTELHNFLNAHGMNYSSQSSAGDVYLPNRTTGVFWGIYENYTDNPE